MLLFLTTVLPFLAHDHAAAAAFLTCRSKNFHGSIIPEFLSDDKRVQSFCEARQQNELKADKKSAYRNLYTLFVQTPLMQFSPSLVLRHWNCAESILKPLLETKYFTRTLQRCSVVDAVLSNDLLQSLAKVRSLIKLEFGSSAVEKTHLEIIINSFVSLETLTIQNAEHLKIVDPNPATKVVSPPPPATKTLRSLTMKNVEPSFASEFVPHFTNLRHLALADQIAFQELDLLPLSSSLPLLTDVSLIYFKLKNTESLKTLLHLSVLQLSSCIMPDSLSFISQDNLPKLATLRIDDSHGLSTSSFASLSHAPNLCVLEVTSDKFNNDCLQYLENMMHLRKLDLSHSKITGDSQPFKMLMQNLFQLEELNLGNCYAVGSRGALGGAFYSAQSRLRFLNLSSCSLVDDHLAGIGALKNTLEVLDLSDNYDLTIEALVHCEDLVKLKKLNLWRCMVNDLSPLKSCLNLEELDVANCIRLTDDSFKVFSEEPSLFPNLRVFKVSGEKLTEKVFDHLSKNNHLVHQLKELDADGMGRLSSSTTARNSICQLKGLRRLNGILFGISETDRTKLAGELMQRLKNLEEVY